MWQAIALFLTGGVFSAIWASAFVAGKVALDYSDPISLLVIRFIAAGVIMLAIVAVTGRGLLIFNLSTLKRSAILGLLNNSLYLGLSFAGLRFISPALTVLIVATAPLMTTLIVILGGGPRSLKQLAGVICGFVGVYIVISSRLAGEAQAWGILLTFLATVSFSIGTVFYKSKADHFDPLVLNGAQNIFGGLFLLPFAASMGVTLSAIPEPEFALSVLYLIFAVSIFDFLLWLALIRKIGAAHASAFHLLNPVFGVIQTALVFGERVTPQDVVGILIVMTSLGLVVFDSTSPAKRRAALSAKAAPIFPRRNKGE